MAFFKNLLKSDTKQDFSDKIPDQLTADQFQVHQTFQHGFPYQPSCLAYDSVQRLLAIGSHSGIVVLIGQSGLECHFKHPLSVAVLQLLFLDNKGVLIGRCSDNSLCLWNIHGHTPSFTHRLEFQREQLSYAYCPYNSEWLYAGMEGGNVYVVNVNGLELSAYVIYWNNVVDGSRKTRPGDVLCIAEHPVDNNKILIAFSDGLCALWNLRTKSVERRYIHNPGKSIVVLTDVAWNGSGRSFSASYSDGTIAIFNLKTDGKPEKVYPPHGQLPNTPPISQLQWFYTDPEPWVIFSGGYPEQNGEIGRGTHTLTLQTSQQTHLMSFKESIVEFLCLPSSPFVTDYQKTFALAVLTQTDILLYDLTSAGIPNFNLPFCFDIHNSPVTSLVYCGNCPDDFIAQLHSVKSKLPHQPASTKQWPLRGGKWGQESPDPWTDLIVTGHLDGTVRLWFCRSVIMQPLFTISTACYFKSSPLPSSGQSPPLRNFSAPSMIPEEKEGSPAPSAILSPPTILTPAAEPPSILENGEELDAPTQGDTPAAETTERIQVESKRKKKKSIFGMPKRGEKKRKKKTSLEELSPGEDNDNGGGGESGEGDGEDEEEQSAPKKPQHLPLDKKKKIMLRKTSTDSLKAVAVTTPDEGLQSNASSSSLRSNDDYVVVSLVNNTPCKKSEEMAVHQVTMSPYARTMCVANISGHVLAFDFSVSSSKRQPQSLLVNMSRDSVIIDEALTDQKEERVAGLTTFNNELDQQLPGFYVRQHCFCYQRVDSRIECVDVTALKYWEQSNLLVIGSDSGLAIINILSNQVLQILGSLTSIQYLADPSTYNKQVHKISHAQPLQRQKSKKNNMSPDVSAHSAHLQKKLTSPLIIPSMELPHMDTSAGTAAATPGGATAKGKGSTPDDHLVTCVELVQFFLTKTSALSTTLWVATYSGHIAIYFINTIELSRGKPSIEIVPTGLIIERRSPVVDLHFLSEWGEQLVSPYKLQEKKEGAPSVLRRQQTAKELRDTTRSVNYVVIVTKESIKVLGFPGNITISQVDSPNSDSRIVQSGFFTCDALPCLMTLLSDGLILIHTLPGLKPMLQYQYQSLNNSRALYTFRISGNGQAIHQISPSQFQRVSVTRHDNLNVPLSRPDMFLSLEDPAPASKGVFTQIFGAITTPTAATTDKEKIFGVEAAGKPWRSVAKRDDYQEKEKQQATKGKRGQSSKQDLGDGASSNAFTQAREKLDKRGKELAQMVDTTERMAADADNFASVAEQLAEKYRKKRF